MIIDVKKYLFIGLKEDLNLFLQRAQKKGCIEFLSEKGVQMTDYPESIQNVMMALKILRKQLVKKSTKLPRDVNVDKLVHTTVESHNCLDKLLEEKRILRTEIARIQPLGYFSLSEVRDIERQSNRYVQFFCVKESMCKALPVLQKLIYIGSEYDMAYFMSISSKIENFPGMIEVRVEKSMHDLEKRLASVLQAIEACKKELEESTVYIDLLKDHLALQLNQHHLVFAKGKASAHLGDALFSIEGWIPKNHVEELFPLLEGLGVHGEEVAVEKGERVPTYMENKSYGKVGEDLVHIYDIPAVKDKDPSLWVFWAFTIFFAMIISDAGYGIILLILALFLRKKYSQAQPLLKRCLRLFTVLSCSCILWGVLSNSYCGMNLSPSNSLNTLSFVHYLVVKKSNYHFTHRDEVYRENIEKYPYLQHVTNGEEFVTRATKHKGERVHYVMIDEFRDSILMELAIFVGIVHISLSLLRYLWRHWAGIGWVLAVMGGYLFFPKFLNATSIIHFMHFVPKEVGYEIGVQLLWGGMIIAIILSLIQNRWRGLLELTKPIELFSDILSYLRIYALGLASMILSNTFNEMGISLGLILGLFIILLGHAINIVVSIMGGTIHGLRLNFIEWYHHSFEGGGKLLQPLKLLKL